MPVQARHDNSCRRDKKSLLMKMKRILYYTLPFLLPIILYFIYNPINTNWTVKKFGCGCPNIDGSFRFNANYFNTILWFIIMGICIWIWRKQMAKRQTFLIGLFFVVLICMICFSRGFWL
jgi:hypothetical protein